MVIFFLSISVWFCFHCYKGLSNGLRLGVKIAKEGTLCMSKPEFEQIKRQLNVCYQCGTCASACGPGLVNPEKNLRVLVQALLSAGDGLSPAVTDLLWLCSTCYQCEDRCPEGVPLASLLIQVKNMAADQGLLPVAVQREIESLEACSFTFRPAKGILARRKKLGLPELPLPDSQEMRDLINRTRWPHESPNPGEESV